MYEKLKKIEFWTTKEIEIFVKTLSLPDKNGFMKQLKDYLEKLRNDKKNLQEEIKETESYIQLFKDQLKFSFDDEIFKVLKENNSF